MTYVLSEKQLSAVCRLDPNARLAHFVKRVADWEKLWCVAGPTFVLAWPHLAYAEAFVAGADSSGEVQEIALAEFMSAWLPRMAEERSKVRVFPVPASPGAELEPEALQQLLERELENY